VGVIGRDGGLDVIDPLCVIVLRATNGLAIVYVFAINVAREAPDARTTASGIIVALSRSATVCQNGSKASIGIPPTVVRVGARAGIRRAPVMVATLKVNEKRGSNRMGPVLVYCASEFSCRTPPPYLVVSNLVTEAAPK